MQGNKISFDELDTMLTDMSFDDDEIEAIFTSVVQGGVKVMGADPEEQETFISDNEEQ